MGVQLETTDGPHVVDSFLDSVLEGAGFVVAVDHDHHFLGVHHSTYADGQCGLGHEVHVVVEETAVGYDGVGGQRLLAGAALEAGSRLVEGDVAVGAYAAHEEVDASCLGDGFLVVLALCHKVLGVAVEDMHVLFLDVDMTEEVVPHEGVVALGMFLGEVDILVHVEGDDVLERDFTCLVEGDEFAVHSQGGAACGATKFEGMLCCWICFVDTAGYIVRSPFRHACVVGFNNESHR